MQNKMDDIWLQREKINDDVLIPLYEKAAEYGSVSALVQLYKIYKRSSRDSKNDHEQLQLIISRIRSKDFEFYQRIIASGQ
jgi:TPR repeat protein